jgi:beta-phosphoglucomutase
MEAGFGWAVIWDVDGTLVDTAELHYRAWATLAKELDKPFAHRDFAATFGLRNQEIIPQLFGASYPAEEVARLGRRKEELYRAAARGGVSVLPGVRRLLESFQHAGFRQAIGSSAPRENLELILALTDSREFFEVVVSMEDTQRGKPDPEVFLIAAKRLGTAPEKCLVLEDAPAGIQAAKAGRMKCVAVHVVGHHTVESHRKAGADLVVSSFEQLSLPQVVRLFQGEPP